MREWFETVQTLPDATVYLVMAGIATLLFLLKLLLMILGGVDSEYDLDFTEADGTVHGSSTSAFGVFSVLSILAFFMGAGWMGFTCRYEWQLGSFTSAALAALFGAALMLLSSFMMYKMRKLTHVPEMNFATAMGQTGRVYLTIPSQGKGRGQVELNVDGRRRILWATSRQDEPIAAFTTVKVVEVHEDRSLTVEPI